MNADLQDLNLSCLKKTKEIVGRGGNLRISESICVLLRIGTRMNADLRDLILNKNNKTKEGWGQI